MLLVKAVVKLHYVKCHIYLQEKVACVDDNDARLALDPHNKYKIQVSAVHKAMDIFLVIKL